jgi:hypothetical protein
MRNKLERGNNMIDYDFAVMISDVTDGGILILEQGLKPNGDPIYRVAVYDGKRWKGARYHSFNAAVTTYRFFKRAMT